MDDRSWFMDVEEFGEYLACRCRYDESGSALLHRKTGRSVRAVVPVHLYGLMADMDAVIEDACQAHGVRYYSKKTGQWETAGSLDHASAFSFSPERNLGACGNAGAVTTNTDEVASKSRMLRDDRQAEGFGHPVEDCGRPLDAI